LAFICFQSDVLTESLAQSRFSRSDITGYDYTLCHFLRGLKDGAEELHEEAAFFVAVR
jgi:hypothetical protein